ncbi:ATP-dependent zinc metalloprotease FtsH [Candidatus Vallotia lariciata]|nr:ATP-dependent zinc metalloprotease FtsH [Candidatus Vallotia lariciata]
MFSKAAVWLVIALVLFTIFRQLDKTHVEDGVTYSQFMNDAKNGKIKSVIVQGRNLDITLTQGQQYQIVSPGDIWMVGDLMKYGVQVSGKADGEPSVLVSALYYLGPTILIIGFWFYVMRQMQSGGKGGAFSFGKSRARLIDENNNAVNFTDVAGCDEAKDEVYELVDFLSDPLKFQKLGGRIPCGVLLIGPPGTGKTLLARAIAGEAKVPFFSISGSDFVEMFVGVGAARVRDMFERAKKHAPCIIFIDEIDAVGRHRGAGMGGGNDEREQTLNQMLVEMDGFEANSGVIVIAATNRSDVLDKALLRPGRFDRQVYVGLPDIRGREQILKVHLRKVPISNDVDASVVARGTPGFSGADLANLVNEAALFAARRSKRSVEMQDFEDAKDKIFMGPERKSAVMREEERRNIAYHESGHAVIAKLLPNADPVHKVTIMPRGWALGVTWQLPEHDRINLYRNKMLEEITILFGGRAAEQVFLNSMSTGASNDFERATKMARDMVTRYGMSDVLGTMVYIDTEQDGMFGRISARSVSEATQQKVDTEIRRILDEQYTLACRLLGENREKVERMVKALREWETIDADQINNIMSGNDPLPPNNLPPPSGGITSSDTDGCIEVKPETGSVTPA